MSIERPKLNSYDYSDLATRLGLLFAHFVQTAPERRLTPPFEITVTSADGEPFLICHADATGVTDSPVPVNEATLKARYPLTATFVDSRGVGVEWIITAPMTQVQ
jgi:hypothetical protein